MSTAIISPLQDKTLSLHSPPLSDFSVLHTASANAVISSLYTFPSLNLTSFKISQLPLGCFIHIMLVQHMMWFPQVHFILIARIIPSVLFVLISLYNITLFVHLLFYKYDGHVLLISSGI